MKETLTAYMIPGVFVHLAEMPMTVNGKVNKKALPEPESTQKDRVGKPPVTELQKQLAGMFAKALGTNRVCIDEDFFEIGGTSMLASKVAMQAMVAGVAVAYQDIFAYPTVEALERHILGAGDSAKTKSISHGQVSDTSEDIEKEEVRPALINNTMEHIREISGEPIGDVLLTGATGFLGIHMLRELIENSIGKITCLVRKSNSETGRKRLESMLVYYFETNYGAEFDSGSLKAVDGDITDRELIMNHDGISFDTVIG